MPLAAQAQQQTPQAFLEGLYRPYLARNFAGQPYQQASRFFVPALARAMERDMQAAKRRGEPPTLDGDPFIDAQDGEISKLAIAVVAKGTTATGTVTFANSGTAKKLLVDLEQTPAGWRIADIRGPNGALSALYKGR
jgi:hypothetical protein